MSDHELWLKTLKMTGAMVGATVVFLGSMSLILVLGAGSVHASPVSEGSRPSSAPGLAPEGRGPDGPTPAKLPQRRGIHGEPRPQGPSEPRQGEAI